MNTLVGTQLHGRYRLDAKIGAGGMSTVFLGFDSVLERQVAIKLLHREIATQSEALERFRREARAVARMNHPNIVRVIDAGEDDGRAYIVFEHVKGETLKQRIQRVGPLPIDEAIAYTIEISRALGAAHAQGIVHRDIKPQNILIEDEGHAKVSDFGIARTLEDHDLTQDGRVLGTTDYISPEQALGQTVGKQSDIYSLGIVLYEMLTGDTPFHAENQVAVAMKHVREEVPDVQHYRPEVSATLASVVERMTGKERNYRYRNVATLAVDLEEALAIEVDRAGGAGEEATSVIRSLPERQRRWFPLRTRRNIPAAGLVAAFLLAAVGVFFAIKLGAEHTQSGTGVGNVKAPPNTKVVSVKRISAHDYDPLGDGREHPSQTRLAVDRDPGTKWTTETYHGGRLTKPGVGIYIDAAPRVVASAMEIQTPGPGWTVEIYAADAGPPKTLPDPGWVRIGGAVVSHSKQRLTLHTAKKPHRYYLAWITQLPPGKQRVEISEIFLFAPKK